MGQAYLHLGLIQASCNGPNLRWSTFKGQGRCPREYWRPKHTFIRDNCTHLATNGSWNEAHMPGPVPEHIFIWDQSACPALYIKIKDTCEGHSQSLPSSATSPHILECIGIERGPMWGPGVWACIPHRKVKEKSAHRTMYCDRAKYPKWRLKAGASPPQGQIRDRSANPSWHTTREKALMQGPWPKFL